MNNYEFAQDFEKNVKLSLNDTSLPFNNSYIDNLFEKCLIIVPRPDENNFSTLYVHSQYPEEYKGICTRISNIRFHQYEAIALAIETAIDFKIPEKAIDLIGLAIKAVLKLFVLASIDLSSCECVLLYYLYTHNAYIKAISEDTILHDIEDGQLKLTRAEYNIAISNLIKLKSITVLNGYITLEEKVILKY